MEKAKILIVEDEAIIAMEMESELQSLGYEVTSIVDTGEKAIEKAEVEQPDIILMDIRIKGKMDGIETADVIRSKFGIPVIFSTAYLDQERIERAKITMPFGYVLKPIQERDLKVTIEMALYTSKVERERKRIERTLRENELKYRTLFENNTFLIYITDIKGNIQLANERAAVFFGKTQETIIGRSFFELRPDRAEMYQNIIDTIVSTGETMRFETLYTTTEEDKWLLVTVSPLKLQNETRLQIVTQDITERKQAEEASRKTEVRFRALIDQAADTILIHNFEGQILDSNERACKNLGYSREELLQMNVANIDIDLNSFAHRKRYWEKLTPSQPISFEGRHKRKDGTLFPVEIRLGLMEREGEKTIVSIVRDIIERKQAERERDLFFKYSTDMLSIIGFDRRFIKVNPAWTRTLGWKEEELLGNVYLDFIHPDDKIAAEVAGNEYRKTGKEILEYQSRFRDNQGGYHLLSWNTVPIKDQQLTFVIAKVIEK